MSKRMKEVKAPRGREDVLTVRVDPLRVATGLRQMPRGGAHATARRPSRARAKLAWRRQAADGAGHRAG